MPFGLMMTFLMSFRKGKFYKTKKKVEFGLKNKVKMLGDEARPGAQKNPRPFTEPVLRIRFHVLRIQIQLKADPALQTKADPDQDKKYKSLSKVK
jgi:hypothetical protein